VPSIARRSAIVLAGDGRAQPPHERQPPGAVEREGGAAPRRGLGRIWELRELGARQVEAVERDGDGDGGGGGGRRGGEVGAPLLLLLLLRAGVEGGDDAGGEGRFA
jgi:hypothetical protein